MPAANTAAPLAVPFRKLRRPTFCRPIGGLLELAIFPRFRCEALYSSERRFCGLLYAAQRLSLSPRTLVNATSVNSEAAELHRPHTDHAYGVSLIRRAKIGRA